MILIDVLNYCRLQMVQDLDKCCGSLSTFTNKCSSCQNRVTLICELAENLKKLQTGKLQVVPV